MKTPTAPRSGRQGSANSNNSNANSFTAAPPTRQQSTVSPARRDSQELIAVLAELFSVFAAEPWQPHKALKIGIHQDLIDRGVLLPDECRAVFRRYCSRLMYRRSLAAGGPRYGLDGEPAGEVTAEQMAGGKSIVTAIEAKRAAKAKTVAADKRTARKAANAPISPEAPRDARPAAAVPSAKPARLGLAELKAAARTRRETAHG